VTEPTFEHGTVWRIPRRPTRDELSRCVSKLPCVFGAVPIYFRFEAGRLVGLIPVCLRSPFGWSLGRTRSYFTFRLEISLPSSSRKRRSSCCAKHRVPGSTSNGYRRATA
jgi:hypothetical protein